MNPRRLVALVRDRIEEARMRRVIRRVARAPFDDLQQRANDDRSLTANCASDDDAPAVDARPGTNAEDLDQLNRIWEASKEAGK